MPTIEARIKSTEIRVYAHARVLATTVAAIAHVAPAGVVDITELQPLIDLYDKAESDHREALAARRESVPA